ncbi:hypothetical protein C9J85_13970 [Haloferax sp. wsp5]|nr:hypothetical protein C9J85_13970 [Haloferax sp. wsp5]
MARSPVRLADCDGRGVGVVRPVISVRLGFDPLRCGSAPFRQLETAQSAVSPAGASPRSSACASPTRLTIRVGSETTLSASVHCLQISPTITVGSGSNRPVRIPDVSRQPRTPARRRTSGQPRRTPRRSPRRPGRKR